MPPVVSMGALLQCSFGTAPVPLSVIPKGRVMSSGMPIATISDSAPMANIPPFAMCTAPSNPAVIAAWGAPSPCVPKVPSPWAPGSPTRIVGGVPALSLSSKCACAFGGVIMINAPGQFTVQAT